MSNAQHITKKFAGQVFAAWMTRTRSGLSADAARQATCSEYGISRDDFDRALTISFRKAA